MSVHLFRVILPVTDIEVAAKFYAHLLGEAGVRVSPGRHYFGANAAGAILACYDPRADGDPVEEGWRHHRNQYLYFAVDDLDAAHGACMNAGGQEISEIETMPWGEKMFYARDPSGNPISFVKAETKFTG